MGGVLWGRFLSARALQIEDSRRGTVSSVIFFQDSSMLVSQRRLQEDERKNNLQTIFIYELQSKRTAGGGARCSRDAQPAGCGSVFALFHLLHGSRITRKPRKSSRRNGPNKLRFAERQRWAGAPQEQLLATLCVPDGGPTGSTTGSDDG